MEEETLLPSPAFMDLDYMNELLLDSFLLERNNGSDDFPVSEPNNQDFARNSITERLIRAIGYIKDCSKDNDVLIQIWAPAIQGSRCVLTTSNQPFQLNKNGSKLAHYREISAGFVFPIEENSNGSHGLPGRVFLGKLPEWTPDVQLFRMEEFPRVRHAQQFDVRGSLAVPVFEGSSHCCLGVIEVVLTTQKIKYLPQLQSVCRALEAVNLRGSILPRAQNVKACDSPHKSVFLEILESLRTACETHRLPLAQTWSPCRHTDDNLVHYLSTVDSACHVADPRVRGFHEACSEHHLLKGQGGVGRAFVTDQPCFSADLMNSSKAEYPLSHYAKMFGLQSSVAIPVQSVLLLDRAEFVLEFFLPRKSCSSPGERQRILTSLSIIVQNVCQSLRVVAGQELQQENCNSVSSKTKRGDRKRGKTAERTIDLQILRQYFTGSLKDAAKSIGVCPTTLKRICRQHGIKRWPSRKIKKVGHSLQKIQRVIDSVQAASGGLPIESFYSNFPELVSKPDEQPRQLHKQLEGDSISPRAAAMSPSSSCSQSSNSSQCCSSGNPDKFHSAGHEKAGLGGVGNMVKRVKSAADLLHSASNGGLKTLPRCQSHTSLLPAKYGDYGALRVKVSFGEEKIRMRLQESWGYRHLLKETARRFGLDDSTGLFQLKYLDDDNEWVLLTCDADLQECFDVCRSSPNQTIKLAFHRLYI